MKKINYDQSLKEDFENIKVKDKKKDIILTDAILATLLNIPIFGIFCLLSAIDLSKVNIACSFFSILIPISFGIVVPILDLNLYVVNPILHIRKRKKKGATSLENIESLANSIDSCDEATRETNFMVSRTNKDNLLESIIVTETDDDTNKIITDFYSLDNHDRLLVLREVKNNIKTKNKDEENRELFILSEEDLPEELPVVRRLEIKKHEEN